VLSPDGMARVGAVPDDEADLGSSGGSASPDAGVNARRVVARLGECASVIDAGLEPWIEEVLAHYIRVTPTTIFGLSARQA